MRKTYLNTTKLYSDIEQMQNDKPQADIYMTGSDQVWGPVMDGTYDSAYCLSFTADCDRRIAFAASFGRTKLTQETEAFYKKWLSRYAAIAVREDSAVQLLNSWGLQAKQVIDPTLMLDTTYWNKFTTEAKKKYILVYQIHNDKKLDRYAKAVAKRTGLPLVRVSASFHQIMRGGKFKFCPDIGEFLSYIKNAQCLITDSFHIGDHFQRRGNIPQVCSYRLLLKEKAHAKGLNISLFLIDLFLDHIYIFNVCIGLFFHKKIYRFTDSSFTEGSHFDQFQI